jgi:hypothetical protein
VSSLGEYEDVIERLREEGLNDEAATLEKFGKNQLRDKAARADELEKELAEERAKRADLELAPKRLAAFEKAGVDVKNLRPADRAVMEMLKSDDLTEEKITKFVEEFQLPVVDPNAGVENESKPVAGQIGDQVRSGGGMAGGSPIVINPNDKNVFADWSTERLAKFQEMYATEWEALKKGFEVSVPALPAETQKLPDSYVERWKELHRTGLPG